MKKRGGKRADLSFEEQPAVKKVQRVGKLENGGTRNEDTEKGTESGDELSVEGRKVAKDKVTVEQQDESAPREALPGGEDGNASVASEFESFDDTMTDGAQIDNAANKERAVKSVAMVEDPKTGGGDPGGKSESTMRKVVDREGYQRNLSADERFAQRAMRGAEGRVERMCASLGVQKSSKWSNISGVNFTATFCVKGCEDNREDGGFKTEMFLDIFRIVREQNKHAVPRITRNKKLEIETKTQEESNIFKQWTKIGNIEVTRLEARSSALWGRIEDVHTQLSEENVLELLKNQGVIKARRVLYTVFRTDANERKIPERRPSHKVDLLFEHTIVPVVTLVGSPHSVMLKAPNPLQCLRCLRYNHKAEKCTEDVVCLNCSKSGHKSKECTNEVRCVNCHLNHHAMSPLCPVYRVWAGAERAKYENKIMERMGAKVRQDVAHTGSETNDNDSKSYAAVTRHLIVESEGQEAIVCQLPRAPQQSKIPKQLASAYKACQTGCSRADGEGDVGQKGQMESVRSNSEGRRRDREVGRMRKMRRAMQSMLKSVSALLASVGEKYPELQQLLKIVESMNEIVEIDNDLDSDERDGVSGRC